ncbi:MAG: lamin tail domain-containing protein [Rhodoferax sp.]
MRIQRHCLAALCIAVLNACGGGGGGGSSSTAVDTSVSGLAATGAGISGGAVTAKCVAGASVSATTNTDGTFTLNLPSQTLPCMLRVTKNSTELYGYLTAYGRVNLTPLTDLALARAGSDTPANLFTNFSSTTATTINANLAAAKTYVSAQLGKLDLNPVTIDVMTGSFTVGDANDQVLDQLGTALTNTGKTLVELRPKALANEDLSSELPVGDIVITEVASGYRSNTSFWFEIVNRSASPVSLNGYTVKTSDAVYNNVSSSQLLGASTFTLPNVTLAPSAHLVVRGKTSSAQTNTSQVVFINDSVNTTKVPAWTSSGSIELIKDGKTRSFVRFGTNTNQPTTGTATFTAPALPYGANSYGYAIVRYGASASTMSAANSWTSVSWTTPAGPNDVPGNAVDADGDGIPDSAEVSGGKFAGLDLYAMGARTEKKDLLIQVDYMNSTDLGVIPQKQALDNVKAAFAAKNVNMIIDVGALFGDAANSGYNWGGGRSITSAKCIGLDTSASCASLYQIKAQYFDVRRVSIFHYAIFGTTQNEQGTSGSSGIAEIGGNDFLVTLGGWGLKRTSQANTNRLVNFQAGTFMHELGHNLNLLHGGFENANFKPNYFSVMNYLYQLDGLSSSASGIGPFERWKCEFFPSECFLTESASTSDSIVLGYSDGTSADMNEYALQESANIGRGADIGVYADWDRSNTLTGSVYALDINDIKGNKSLSSALKDHNDWTNMLLAFGRSPSGAFGVRMESTSVPERTLDPMSNDRQPYIVETLHAPLH